MLINSDTEEQRQTAAAQPWRQTIICTRRIQFCAGHRLWRHEGKCAYLHGHNYVAYFHAFADGLDEIGRIIDFSELKSRLGEWIEANWDHGFLLNRADEETRAAVACIPGQKLFMLDGNPTAENLAASLLREVAPVVLAGTGVRIVKVVLWETENCMVEVSV